MSTITLQSLKTEVPEAYEWLRGSKFLGSGTFGRVYEKNGRAIKITRTKQEYKIASRIQGKRLPGVAYVYQAYARGNFYFIEQELLTRKLFDRHQRRAIKLCTSTMYQLSPQHRQDLESVLAVVFAEVSLRYITPENLVAIRKVADNLTRGVHSLAKHGISHLDLHSHNVLQTLDGKECKIIDFGLTRMKK